jgi:hypothetical protein
MTVRRKSRRTSGGGEQRGVTSRHIAVRRAALGIALARRPPASSRPAASARGRVGQSTRTAIALRQVDAAQPRRAPSEPRAMLRACIDAASTLRARLGVSGHRYACTTARSRRSRRSWPRRRTSRSSISGCRISPATKSLGASACGSAAAAACSRRCRGPARRRISTRPATPNRRPPRQAVRLRSHAPGAAARRRGRGALSPQRGQHGRRLPETPGAGNGHRWPAGPPH